MALCAARVSRKMLILKLMEGNLPVDIEIDRDHMNGDYCLILTRKDRAHTSQAVMWMSHDELQQLIGVLVRETADPGIALTLVEG